MKKDIKNDIYFEARVYDKSDLEIKTVKNQSSPNFGQNFIGGKLDIVLDEAGINVVSIHYTYVAPKTKKGGVNKTYTALEKIIKEGKSWLSDGKDEAMKVKIKTAFATNDFISSRDETLVESIRMEGGFVEFIDTLPEKEFDRSLFVVDMVINNVTENEGNEERQISPYLAVKGCTFNFKGEMIPLEFRTRNEEAINYFQSLDASPSNPVFTQVKGIVNNIKTKVPVVEESAFGEASVSYRERNLKENIITWSKPVTYEFGEDITAEELKKAIQDRQVHLADVKKQHEDYKNNNGTVANSNNQESGTVPTGTYNF